MVKLELDAIHIMIKGCLSHLSRGGRKARAEFDRNRRSRQRLPPPLKSPSGTRCAQLVGNHQVRLAVTQDREDGRKGGREEGRKGGREEGRKGGREGGR